MKPEFFLVRPLEQEHIDYVARVDREVFGPTVVAPEAVREQMRLYPSALLGLFDGADPVGYTSAWPLNRAWAERFANGEVSETDLSPGAMAPPSQQPWAIYIASVVVAAEYKGHGLGARLLETAIARWQRYFLPPTSGELWAMTFSDAGASIAGRVGFNLLRPATAMADGAALMRRPWLNPAAEN
jgi:GNAT superfamily N-acetyltransferase